MQLVVTRRVSRDTKATPEDVRLLKKALNRLGYYYPNAKHGITKIADAAMIDALKAFQRDNGLTLDGVIVPGGETQKALNEKLVRQEVDKTVQLVWHCARGEKRWGY